MEAAELKQRTIAKKTMYQNNRNFHSPLIDENFDKTRPDSCRLKIYIFLANPMESS